jgi:hypothetical protein
LARAAARNDLDRFREASPAFRVPPVHLPLRKATEQHGRDPLVPLEAVADGLTGLSVLEGGPGSGKSTTLLQLAQLISDRHACKVALLANVPEWSVSSAQDDLLAHCANRATFVEQGVTVHHLRSLAQAGNLVVLLDGWNEVPSDSLHRVLLGLGRLRREFPRVALVVATRMATGLAEADAVFRVMSLTDQLRDDIVTHTALPQDPRREAVRRDAALDEITRTPLYLAAFLAAPASVEPVRGELPGCAWSIS